MYTYICKDIFNFLKSYLLSISQIRASCLLSSMIFFCLFIFFISQNKAEKIVSRKIFDEEIGFLKDVIAQLNEKMNMMEMEFQSVKEELNILKESLKSDALDHQSRNHFQAVWCGNHGGVLHSGENVTYDNIFTSDTTNLDDMEITGLNPSTGEFVSDFSETWMISVTVASGVDAGQENLLHLYLNGQRVEESAIRTNRNDWAPSYTAVTAQEGGLCFSASQRGILSSSMQTRLRGVYRRLQLAFSLQAFKNILTL